MKRVFCFVVAAVFLCCFFASVFCLTSFADPYVSPSLDDVVSDYPIKAVYIGSNFPTVPVQSGYLGYVRIIDVGNEVFVPVTKIELRTLSSGTVSQYYSPVTGGYYSITDHIFYTTSAFADQFFSDSGWVLSDMSVSGSVFNVFGSVGGFLTSSTSSFVSLFYDGGLTTVGILSVIALGISVLFLLLGVIQRFYI